ncbi:MAG: hypothetical protein EOO06_19860 [Chitinophagaceae bacterium]|nr:MAG: hypothetical protein EOO06_19860 [Chitinophagaceae bacterium]
MHIMEKHLEHEEVEEVTDHMMCFFIAHPPSVAERPQPPRPYYMPRQPPALIPQPPQRFMSPYSSQWSTVEEIGDDVGALTVVDENPEGYWDIDSVQEVEVVQERPRARWTLGRLPLGARH